MTQLLPPPPPAPPAPPPPEGHPGPPALLNGPHHGVVPLTRSSPLNGDGSLNGARILLIDGGDALLTRLSAEGVYVGHLSDATNLARTVNRAPWDIIVAGPDQASAGALERLAQVRAERPDMGLVMTINGHQPADLAMFVRARPDELVRLPLGEGALEAALTSTFDVVRKRRGIAAQSAARAAVSPPPTLAQVFVVSGPSGGSGKTTVAMELANLLVRHTDGPVTLADLDTQFGGVASALQLRPTASAYEVLFDDLGRRYDRRLVGEHIPDALVTAPDGFRVLAAPADPVQGDAIGADEVSTLVGALRRTCSALVLDCPAGLGERTLTALDRADHHIVVTHIDVPAIAHLRTYISTIQRLGMDADHQTIVLNKEIPGSGVTGRDVETVFGRVGGILPFEPLVPRARNEGRLITAMNDAHAFGDLLCQILVPLIPTAQPTSPAPRRRRTLFRRN